MRLTQRSNPTYAVGTINVLRHRSRTGFRRKGRRGADLCGPLDLSLAARPWEDLLPQCAGGPLATDLRRSAVGGVPMAFVPQGRNLWRGAAATVSLCDPTSQKERDHRATQPRGWPMACALGFSARIGVPRPGVCSFSGDRVARSVWELPLRRHPFLGTHVEDHSTVHGTHPKT